MNLANTMKLRNLKASAAGAQATVPDPRSADEWIKNWLDKKNKRLDDLRKDLHNLLDYPEPVEIESAYREDKRSAFPQDPGRVAGHGRWAVVSPEDEIISRWDTKEEAEAAAWPAWRGVKPSATGASGGARVKELTGGGPGSGRHPLPEGYKVEPHTGGGVLQRGTGIRQAGYKWKLTFPDGKSMKFMHKDSAESFAHSHYSKSINSAEEDACDECDTDECEDTCEEDEIDAADIFQDEELGDKTRAAFLKHEKPEIVKNADILRKGDRRPSSRGQGSAGTGGAGAGGAGGGAGI